MGGDVSHAVCSLVNGIVMRGACVSLDFSKQRAGLGQTVHITGANCLIVWNCFSFAIDWVGVK